MMPPKLHDLSHLITDGMPVYPGDPTVHIHTALDLEQDGVAVTGLRLGSHTGTHIDAPSHTVKGGRTMADVTLEELVGDALVIRMPELHEHEIYGWVHLNAGAPIPSHVPPIIVIDTGWARWFSDARAMRHPALDAAAARELVTRGMRILAVDTFSPDLTDGSADFPVHEVVLGGGGLIVENLCGLETLPVHVRIGFFPLRLDGDGAPVRAVAFT
ncbi:MULTISPECIES: cyclase family protein [unclassified Salinibacterium]|uniref:cyclase family protein n=1 Tax=unclassified Salinibacterium TaxID=2632331 RepID=UPI001CD71BF4|nr:MULTISPECIES: cyclase family protein [unclassified Salinibacterium]